MVLVGVGVRVAVAVELAVGVLVEIDVRVGVALRVGEGSATPKFAVTVCCWSTVTVVAALPGSATLPVQLVNA